MLVRRHRAMTIGLNLAALGLFPEAGGGSPPA
jgi:hypothetical protein